MRVNGITLNVEQYGTGRPLLLLHGFTGSAATWAALIGALPPHIRAICPDLIGHGRSDAPPDAARYRMERCVADLLALLDALELERADVLGYSMGGRVALHLAAAAPERVGALLLESSSPGIADASERRARAAADEALADMIERDGLAAFVDRWERLPLFASQAALPKDTRAHLRDQRLRNNPLARPTACAAWAQAGQNRCGIGWPARRFSAAERRRAGSQIPRAGRQNAGPAAAGAHGESGRMPGMPGILNQPQAFPQKRFKICKPNTF